MSALPFPLSADDGSGSIPGAATRPDRRYKRPSPELNDPLADVDPRCVLGGLMAAGSALAAVLFLIA